MMGRVRVGTSGWSYAEWHGPFYPGSVSRKAELAHASRVFDSLEINRSFYSLLTPACCRAWYEDTPRGFVFALKGSSFITHNKKLRDVELPLANYFASGVLALEEKLGPIVWQLPRTLAYDEERLHAFFAALPKTSEGAAKLAHKHDHRVRRGAYLTPRANRRLRHAIEPRHESFANPTFYRLARRFNVAVALSDSPEWPAIDAQTASFSYVRLHGAEKLYASRYTDRELKRWAARVRAWRDGSSRARDHATRPGRGRDVYVYFDNDAHAHAPADAQRLIALL